MDFKTKNMEKIIKITGISQLKMAFIAVLEDLGWKPAGTSTKTAIINEGHDIGVNEHFKEQKVFATIDFFNYDIKHKYQTITEYKLPQQWDEALSILTSPGEQQVDWEIQSFKTSNKVFIDLCTNGLYGWRNCKGEFKVKELLVADTFEYTVSNGDLFIHSVKHIPTGEVFTVGDIVQNKTLKTPSAAITSFVINAHNHCLAVTSSYSSGIRLEKLVKIAEVVPVEPEKKVVFVSEDGIKMHRGANYWYYSPGYAEPIAAVAWEGPVYADKGFSTKEAAQAYIDRLKPKVLLVTQDGVEITNKETYVYCYKISTKKASFASPYCDLKIEIQDSTDKDWLVFSSFEAREAWIDANIPKVLLTTEDGVEVTDKDFWLYGLDCNFIILGAYTSMAPNFINTKWFSTKEKRDEYVLMYKPLFSLNEVLSHYNETKSDWERRAKARLKNQ